MPFSLAEKIAAVTGGGSGIGLAVTLELARAGAHVFILDLNLATAEEAAKRVESEGFAATAVECDVSSQTSVDLAFASIGRTCGRLDILVNNAGIVTVGNALKATETDMDRMYAVNVKGVFFCTKAALAMMTSNDRGGSIVNLASIDNAVINATTMEFIKNASKNFL